VHRALDVFSQVAAERMATLAEFERLRAKLTARCGTEWERFAYTAACNKLAHLGSVTMRWPFAFWMRRQTLLRDGRGKSPVQCELAYTSFEVSRRGGSCASA